MIKGLTEVEDGKKEREYLIRSLKKVDKKSIKRRN